VYAYVSKIAKTTKKGLYSPLKCESLDTYVLSYKSLCSKFDDIDIAFNTGFVSRKKYAILLL
jgi:hypothetical protein